MEAVSERGEAIMVVALWRNRLFSSASGVMMRFITLPGGNGDNGGGGACAMAW